MSITLLRQEGSRHENKWNLHFTNVTRDAGVGDPQHSMGPTFLDYDNDGYLDLFNSTCSGHITFFENNGNGTFSKIGKQLGLTQKNHNSWGSASVDYDDDGDLGIYVANVFENDLLLRNDGGNSNNWLRVKMIGTQSNRAGIGTVVRVKTGDATQIRPIGLTNTNSSMMQSRSLGSYCSHKR